MSRPRHVVTIAKGVELAFRLIPAGPFRMGQRGIRADEEPVHTVIIPYSFWMAETPVTQAQYKAFNPQHENHFNYQPTCPAESITWPDARKYVQAIDRHCRATLPIGYRIALPLEAEWEYACRAGTTTKYHSGDGESALDNVAWYDKNSGSSTHPVAEKDPNAWGLYDMHGNVWEWCEDAWDPDAYKRRVLGYCAERNWKAAAGDSRLVLRGGSWDDSATDCRAESRDRSHSVYWLGFGGFRLVLVPGPPASGSETRTAEPEGRAGVRGKSVEAVPEGVRGRKAWWKIF